MVTFSVPFNQEGTNTHKKYFSFSVPERAVLFVGSRYCEVPPRTCRDLIQAFAHHGFSFLVGCAGGVDRSFRKALAHSAYTDRCFVASAFPHRCKHSHSYGLSSWCVVPKNLPPKAALHRRTVWMVKRCSVVVLFPENPLERSWGKGSQLVLKASMYHLKPVFVVASTPPKSSIHYRVLASNLFGVVDGYWVVPHPVHEGGTCDYE